MNRSTIAVALLCVIATRATAAEEIKLPAEITPALRAACETDVRRLCIRDGSTLEQVKSCVIAKYLKLGQRCRSEIASAGLMP
jgi:hypothetical protein